ncbi:MAG TPA: adenylate/guanylate cyclase domain-containing protein [Caldimonas sp.]|nr:adenylate/guanylate cyclase domain-containing protein [Caldimonas sp.]HEX4235620.1 adenylate/guanylate cyclase domain-containing protein [Caldimonas sp.]
MDTSTPEEVRRLQEALATLESQRSLLGEGAFESVVGPIRARLAQLDGIQQAGPIGAAAPVVKQVSVLFLDLVGSTALGRDLDPEELSTIVDGALSRFSAVVRRHGGKVLQYAGDSVLAAFGADRVEEDDAERAVRCGLALLAEALAIEAELRARHRHEGFGIRVGVHTGTVLLGGGVDAESTIRGHAVNFAARMEQTAPAGALRISDSTYRHVRGVFDADVQPPLQVKGVEEPVVTYLVRRAKVRSFRVAARGVEGIETRMIGREREFDLLRAAFEGLFAPGAGLVCITIVADAGLGKSRLLYEFQDWVEARAAASCLFQGRATPQTQGQPYGLLRDILAWRALIQDTDSMVVAKRKLEQLVVPLFAGDEGAHEAEAHAHVLGQMIGLDFSASRHVAGIREDVRQIRIRGFRTAALAMQRMNDVDAAPRLLLLEDLHWADDASLDFLDYLVQTLADVPMLIVSSSRPDLFERREAMLGAVKSRIDLRPLDMTMRDALAGELLKRLDRVPPALRSLVTGAADGNPFYMEELVKMLIDSRAIVPGPGAWRVDPERVIATEVPSTLTGVLQARLDRLSRDEREALQVGSVVGLTFWDKAIAFIDAGSERQLPRLAARELIRSREDRLEDAPTPEDAREYVFGHQLLHQVTYETILKSRRERAHLRTAEWFANMSGARANDFVGLAAEHFDRAGEPGRACEYFARAAEHAASTFASVSALRYIERGLGLAGPADAGVRWRLLATRERTLDLQGRRVEQRADVEALTELAEGLDEERQGEAAYRQADIAMRTGDYATSEREARRAAAIGSRIGSNDLLLRAQMRLSAALANQGNPVEGEKIARIGRDLARATGLRRHEIFLLNSLGICSELSGDSGMQLSYLLQGLALGRELNDRRIEAVLLANAGLIFFRLGGDAQAEQHLADALRRNRELGIREMEGHVLCSMAELALRHRDGVRARATGESALDIAVEVRSRQNETSALAICGNADLLLCRWEESARSFERMEALARDIAFPPAVLDALEGQTRLALAQGDIDRATSRLETLLACADLRDASTAGRAGGLGGAMEHWIRLTTYKVRARTNDPRTAAALAVAYRGLQSEAAAIRDEHWRHSFLHNVPEHREIVELWAKHSAPADQRDLGR